MAIPRAAAAFVPLLLMLGACYQPPVAITTFPPVVTIGLPSATPTESAPASSPPIPSPTPSATPTLTPVPSPSPTAPPTPTISAVPSSSIVPPSPTFGVPSVYCVNGWTSPAPGTPLYVEALSVLESQMGAQGPWTVTEMRFFNGPDIPGIEPHYPVVERWYVRATLVSDPNFRGRWLIEKRTVDIEGISAVAPWASFGYQSPDWTGFEGEGAPTTYIGLPGQWSGIPYDFVTGEGDSGQPGLPSEVTGCLDAT